MSEEARLRCIELLDEKVEMLKEINLLRTQVRDLRLQRDEEFDDHAHTLETLAACQKERDECESKWNMTADALVMATGQIGSLVAALEQVKHDAESQRVWNGTGWSYRYPFGRIHDTATAALAKLGADKRGEV